MFTEAYLESSRISTMELFSLRLNYILKAYLTRSNCLQIPFFTQHTLREKTYNCENFCLVNNRTISFSKFEIMQWNDVINKKGFLNQHLLKLLKLLHCFLFSLFQILLSKQLQKVKDKKRCCFRRAICRTPRSFLNQTRRAFFARL